MESLSIGIKCRSIAKTKDYKRFGKRNKRFDDWNTGFTLWETNPYVLKF